MEFPAPTSIEGAYWYLISIIVAVAIVCGLYLVAAIAGVAPDPSDLVDPVVLNVGATAAAQPAVA